MKRVIFLGSYLAIWANVLWGCATVDVDGWNSTGWTDEPEMDGLSDTGKNEEKIGVEKDEDGTDTQPDLCAADPDKTEPGVCGCGVADAPEAIADDDGDGWPNCLDACPHNSTKSLPLEGGCEVDDTDADGVDDSVDICPTNPYVTNEQDLLDWKPLSTHDIVHPGQTREQLYVERCLLDSVHTLHIFSPLDIPAIANAAHVWAVKLEADINLNARHGASSSCLPPLERYLIPGTVYLDGNGKTITSADDSGGRCALSHALFESLRGAKDLVLQLDYEGDVQAGLALDAFGEFENIRYQGRFVNLFAYGHSSAREDGVGGFFRTLHDCTIADVVADRAEFVLNDAKFGGIAYTVERCTFDYDVLNDVALLQSNQGEAAGFAYDIDRVEGIRNRVGKVEGDAVGFVYQVHEAYDIDNEVGLVRSGSGMFGECMNACRIDHVRNRVHDLENATAFMGNLWTWGMTGDVEISDVQNEVTGRLVDGAAFVDTIYASGPSLKYGEPRLKTIRIHDVASRVKEQTFTRVLWKRPYWGSFVGSVIHEQYFSDDSVHFLVEDVPPLLELSRIDTEVGSVTANVPASMFVGFVGLDASRDCLGRFDVMKSPLGLLMTLKDVFVQGRVFVQPETAFASLIGQVDDAQNAFDDCSDSFIPSEVPDWHFADARATVLSVDARSLGSNARVLSPLIGTLQSVVPEKYLVMTHQDTYFVDTMNRGPQRYADAIALGLDVNGHVAEQIIKQLDQYGSQWEFVFPYADDPFYGVPRFEVVVEP